MPQTTHGLNAPFVTWWYALYNSEARQGMELLPHEKESLRKIGNEEVFASSNYQPRHRQKSKVCRGSFYISRAKFISSPSAPTGLLAWWIFWAKGQPPFGLGPPSGEILGTHWTVHVAGKFLLHFFSSWWDGNWILFLMGATRWARWGPRLLPNIDSLWRSQRQPPPPRLNRQTLS